MSPKSSLTFYIFATVIGTAMVQKFDSKTRYNQNQRWLPSKRAKFKYILHFTSPPTVLPSPFNGTGMKPFSKANCYESNCKISYVYRRDFMTFKKFDAIIFQGPDFWYKPSLIDSFPAAKDRSPTQKFVYYSAESAGNYPLCDEELDGFFNLTWTFRLNSDLQYPYLIIRDIYGTIIGPRTHMHWMDIDDMIPIGRAVEKKLVSKEKAVAWMASICKTGSKREEYVERLGEELSNYGLDLDIFGKCAKAHFICDRSDLLLPSCWEIIETEYYFYLSFENSFDEDYVTEKLLNPLQHYTVPIVYGAANYSRFLPDGIYLNAKKLGVTNLVKEIINIINNKQKYYNFFKWHNHYSYHSPYETPETHPVCALCSLLNKEMPHKSYNSFRKWWNLAGECPTETPTTPEHF